MKMFEVNGKIVWGEWQEWKGRPGMVEVNGRRGREGQKQNISHELPSTKIFYFFRLTCFFADIRTLGATNYEIRC